MFPFNGSQWGPVLFGSRCSSRYIFCVLEKNVIKVWNDMMNNDGRTVTYNLGQKRNSHYSRFDEQVQRQTIVSFESVVRMHNKTIIVY